MCVKHIWSKELFATLSMIPRHRQGTLHYPTTIQCDTHNAVNVWPSACHRPVMYTIQYTGTVFLHDTKQTRLICLPMQNKSHSTLRGKSYSALQALSAVISRFTSDFQSRARMRVWGGGGTIKKPLQVHISYSRLSHVSRC